MSVTRLSAVCILLLALTILPSACEQPYPQGQAIYENQCANCHQPDGSGLVGNIPPLAGADWLANYREELPCVIRFGMAGPMAVNGLSYNAVMAGHPKLTNTEIANVSNYILTAWGNNLPPLRPADIPTLLEACDYPIIKEGNPQLLPIR